MVFSDYLEVSRRSFRSSQIPATSSLTRFLRLPLHVLAVAGISAAHQPI
jgi:hypothetical protein